VEDVEPSFSGRRELRAQNADETQTAPNGAFNVTEFGTVKNPEQFKALYAYSPYHSRKMIARLEEANKSDKPILLRTSSSAGHGIGTALSERIKQLADVYSFLFGQLGMTEKK
jgi:prolyl oligopeptidase